MRVAIFSICMLLSVCARASGAFISLKAYLESITGKPVSQLVADTNDMNSSTRGTLTFGKVSPQWQPDADEQFSYLFILRKMNDGGVVEIIRSKGFSVYDSRGRTYMEMLSVSSDRKFSVPVIHRSACGPSMDTYVFAEVKNVWRLAGLDTESYECGDANDAIGANGRATSRNFLTGLVTKREFKKNKIVGRKSEMHKFPVFPLVDFRPFDDRYGW